MSTFTFRPAKREQTPLIIGLAGPSKSGKTYSALRLATGLANGGKVAMINTEGARGHMYADRFAYDTVDIGEPFGYDRYREALLAAKAINPAVVIIDSVSHAHEGPGGMLAQHEKHLDDKAGDDYKKRERLTWTAWIKPKAEEAHFINTMIQLNFAVILCFRAKEKIKIVRGQEPVPMGWQAICSDRIPFETTATLILPPGSKGVPDLTAQASELREPLDTLIKATQIDENLGRKLAQWAAGGKQKASPQDPPQTAPISPATAALAGEAPTITADQAIHLDDQIKELGRKRGDLLTGVRAPALCKRLSQLPAEMYDDALKWLEALKEKQHEPT